MQHVWSDDELTVHWSFTPDELALVPHGSDANRLEFAVQLKFVDLEGRFPRTPREIPLAALGFVAEQLGLSPVVLQQYAWRGRTRKQHRAAIRTFVGFRTFTAADVSTLDTWLRQAILPSEQNPHHLVDLALDWCREHRLEPPTPQRLERLIRSALHHHTSEFFATIMQAARHVGRHGHRDTTLILLMYRHGLRVSEVSRLRWDAIDLKTALLHVRRLKRGCGGNASALRPRTACPLQAATRHARASLCFSLRTVQPAQRSHHPPYYSARGP